MVAPVLLEDALLLLGQGTQLARAALQVRVQAAQALPSPRGCLLRSDTGREAPSGCAQESWPRQGCRQPTQPALGLTRRSRYWLRMVAASCLDQGGENTGPVREEVQGRMHPTSLGLPCPSSIPSRRGPARPRSGSDRRKGTRGPNRGVCPTAHPPVLRGSAAAARRRRFPSAGCCVQRPAAPAPPCPAHTGPRRPASAEELAAQLCHRAGVGSPTPSLPLHPASPSAGDGAGHSGRGWTGQVLPG